MKDFYFSSYGHCCDVITPIFDDNSKNKYRRIFFIIFSVLFSTLRTFHKVSVTSDWGGGGGLHVRNWEMAGTSFVLLTRNHIFMFISEHEEIFVWL